MTYLGTQKSFQLYASGFHGATRSSTNGQAPVQTFAWATWLSPGYFGTDGGFGWGLQDMNVLSHEIGEWADDPFGTNLVQAWPFVPGLPEYGCSSVLETGDAPGGNGFAMGTNTFRQGPNPDGTQTADGYYHPQDLLMLPWFLRLAPNTMSEPTQTPSTDIGRYSFMGDHRARRCSGRERSSRGADGCAAAARRLAAAHVERNVGWCDRVPVDAHRPALVRFNSEPCRRRDVRLQHRRRRPVHVPRRGV
jgi:hypothetical protein